MRAEQAELRESMAGVLRNAGLDQDRVASLERGVEALVGSVGRLQSDSRGPAADLQARAAAESAGAAIMAIARCCGFLLPDDRPAGASEAAGCPCYDGAPPKVCAVREWEQQHGAFLWQRIE